MTGFTVPAMPPIDVERHAFILRYRTTDCRKLSKLFKIVEHRAGIEPANTGFAVGSSGPMPN